MVIIEAMSCGTPVIAFNRGSVPELIDDGVSGFIVSNVEEAVNAVNKINITLRSMVRKMFEEKYTAARMAKDYLKIYESLVHSNHNNASPVNHGYPDHQNKKAWKQHVINQ